MQIEIGYDENTIQYYWKMHDGPEEIDYSFGYCNTLKECFAEIESTRQFIAEDYVSDKQRAPKATQVNNPLATQIIEELDLYGSYWPPKVANMLNVVADAIEIRADKKLELDPIEVVEWLRDEAVQARLNPHR